jgi:hypothetical protein
LLGRRDPKAPLRGYLVLARLLKASPYPG